jgi:hypothetical protein
VKLKPGSPNEKLGELVMFLSHARSGSINLTIQMTPFYDFLKEMPSNLLKMVDELYQQLEHELRLNIVQCVIMLRNKKVFSAEECLPSIVF